MQEQRPWNGPLAAAVGVLALDTVGLVAAGIFLLVRTHDGGAHSHRDALAEGLFTLLGAAIFALLTAALAPPRIRLAARTPALLLELIMIPVAIGLFQSGRPAVGAPLLVSALVVLVGLPVGTRAVAPADRA